MTEPQTIELTAHVEEKASNDPCGLLRMQMVMTAVITIVLLGFAYIARHDDPTLAGLVVGAAITRWLHESASTGRAIEKRRTGA